MGRLHYSGLRLFQKRLGPQVEVSRNDVVYMAEQY